MILIVCCSRNYKNEDNVKVKAEVNILKEELTEIEYYSIIMKKFNFNDFPCENNEAIIIADTVIINNLTDLPKEIKKQIRNDFNIENPNYNCKYKIITWGCGSPCQIVAIYDSKTGQLLRTFTTSYGAKYTLKSNLLILNPPTEVAMDTNQRNIIGEPEFWEMKNEKFIKIN